MAKENRVPFFIPVLAIIIVVLMGFYAACLDKSFPDKSVKGFYQAYFAQDYTEAAGNLSVLLANNTTEFAGKTTAELMEMRDAVTTVLATSLSNAAAYAEPTEGISIEILLGSVKKGTSTALVPFNVYTEGVEEPETRIALLAKEGAAYKLLATQAIEAEELEHLAHGLDLSIWDAYVANN